MNDLEALLETAGGALTIGILLLMLIWESFRPYFDQFRQTPKARISHGLRNLALGAVNALLIGAGFVLLWQWAAEASQSYGIGLLHVLAGPMWFEALLAILLLDLWTYFWHRANHEIPFLWRFHQVHHSDPRMDVTTASRFHVGEIFFSSLLRIPLVFLLGLQLWQLALYEAAMFAVVQFHHANVGLPGWLDRLLRIVIVTPAMHKIHHSREPRETNSNYTSLLSCWDRLFGSFRMRNPGSLHRIRFGLDGRDDTRMQRMSGILGMPWQALPELEREKRAKGKP